MRLLFDDLVGAAEQRVWDGEAERLGGLEVDDELELCRLLDWQIGRLRTLQDLVHIGCGTPVHVTPVRPVRHEPARFYKLLSQKHRREPGLGRQVEQPLPVLAKDYTEPRHDQSARALLNHRLEGRLKIVRASAPRPESAPSSRIGPPLRSL